MKVKNRQSGTVSEATKNEDGTYTVEGHTFTREDMSKTYIPIKDKPKEEVVDASNVAVSVAENSWQSETLGALALALAKAQGKFGTIEKKTEAYNYKYATLADTLNMVRPILLENELALTQLTISRTEGGQLMSGIKSMLIHSSGEWISSEAYLPAKATKSNNVAQVQGSWGTYLRRYHIMSMLNLATEDKDAKA